MAKKAITEVENKIKKILTDGTAEVSDIAEKVEAARQRQKAANESMDAAATAGDFKAYQKAKVEREDAEDAIEMHGKRLDALKYTPFISKGEYETGVTQIMEALREVSYEAKKRIIEHMEQIRSIAAEFADDISYGNKVLHQWQHEIYRDDACITTATGKRIHSNSNEKEFKDFTVSQFASHILDGEFYKELVSQCK